MKLPVYDVTQVDRRTVEGWLSSAKGVDATNAGMYGNQVTMALKVTAVYNTLLQGTLSHEGKLAVRLFMSRIAQAAWEVEPYQDVTLELEAIMDELEVKMRWVSDFYTFLQHCLRRGQLEKQDSRLDIMYEIPGDTPNMQGHRIQLTGAENDPTGDTSSDVTSLL